MATIERNCRYPEYTSDARKVGGQEGIKNFIKDFNTLMLDVGLVKSSLTGQLDVNSIPDINLDSLFGTTYFNPNAATPTNVTYYSPLEYNFTDNLQNDYPIKLKFEFMWFVVYMKSTYKATDLPSFGCKATFTIGTKTYVNYFFLPVSFNTHTSALYKDGFPDLSVNTIVARKRQSLICYKADSGYFYINLCPDSFYNIQCGDTFRQASMLQFVINRSKNQDGSINNSFVRIIHPNSSYYQESSTYYYQNSRYNMAYGNNFSTVIVSYTASSANYTNTIQFQAPLHAQIYKNNYETMVYMSQTWDETNQTSGYDPFILIGNSVISPGTSETTVNVTLNEGETKKYLILSNSENNMYPYSSGQCLLVYYN